MKNKIIKLVSLVMMGVMMWGNTVAFAGMEQVTIADSISFGIDWSNQMPLCPGQGNPVQEDCWYVPNNALDFNLTGPSMVHDDDINTIWNSGAYRNQQPYIVLDLGSEKTFSQLKLMPRNHDNLNGINEWLYEVSNDNINFSVLQDSNSDNYIGSAINSNWGITDLDESVSYRYLKVIPINWPGAGFGAWVAIYEIEVWNDVAVGIPEFSTYIYLTTLAFTFAVGYRKIPELLREKN